jgi:HSP20 family protein
MTKLKTIHSQGSHDQHHENPQTGGSHHPAVVFRRPHHSLPSGFADEYFHYHSPFGSARSFDEWMPVLHNLERGDDHVIQHSSPGYEITETEKGYQIDIDVPGVHLKDMSLDLENYGHVLHVKGQREMHRNGSMTTIKFEKRFRIGHNIDHDSVTAHLSEGVLLITAPKLKNIEKKPKHIMIYNGEEP